jgi:hypothetical protein
LNGVHWNTGQQIPFFSASGDMRSVWLVFGVSALASSVLGCGAQAEKLVPVVGKVMLDGKPWTIGDVGFFPDASQGNPSGQASIGVIKPDGTYQVFTAGKPGVRPGWYKVVVWATKDLAAAGNPWGPDGKRRTIHWLIDPKFTSEDTTPLTKEVVDRSPPGHYDLELAK